MKPLPTSERLAILSKRVETLRSQVKRYGKRYLLFNRLLQAEDALARVESDLRGEMRGAS